MAGWKADPSVEMKAERMVDRWLAQMVVTRAVSWVDQWAEHLADR